MTMIKLPGCRAIQDPISCNILRTPTPCVWLVQEWVVQGVSKVQLSVGLNASKTAEFLDSTQIKMKGYLEGRDARELRSWVERRECGNHCNEVWPTVMKATVKILALVKGSGLLVVSDTVKIINTISKSRLCINLQWWECVTNQGWAQSNAEVLRIKGEKKWHLFSPMAVLYAWPTFKNFRTLKGI